MLKNKNIFITGIEKVSEKKLVKHVLKTVHLFMPSLDLNLMLKNLENIKT